MCVRACYICMQRGNHTHRLGCLIIMLERVCKGSSRAGLWRGGAGPEECLMYME